MPEAVSLQVLLSAVMQLLAPGAHGSYPLMFVWLGPGACCCSVSCCWPPKCVLACALCAFAVLCFPRFWLLGRLLGQQFALYVTARDDPGRNPMIVLLQCHCGDCFCALWGGSSPLEPHGLAEAMSAASLELAAGCSAVGSGWARATSCCVEELAVGISLSLSPARAIGSAWSWAARDGAQDMFRNCWRHLHGRAGTTTQRCR